MNGTVNHPTDAQSEQLAFLNEEMGESLQVVGKIGRHGLDSRWPKPDGPSNSDMLEKEIGHVLAAVDILIERGTLDPARINASRRAKHDSVRQWLHCSENIEAAETLLQSSIFETDIEVKRESEAVAAVRALLNAPHHDHFASRLSDGELAAVERMKSLIADVDAQR